MSPSETIQLAQALIQRPSVTPDDQGCQTLIADLLAPMGFQIEHLHFHEVENLWATHGNTKPLVVFAGHTDVVPTGPEEQWSHPPFSADIHGGMIHGRGSADMKGSLAAMITACRHFIDKHPNHAGSIGFLITSDEEGPARWGTREVISTLEARGDKIDYCIVGEPTSGASLADTIKVGRRGSLNGKITINGKQGHIAYPHLANNAIHLAAPLLQDLINIEWDQGNDHFPPTSFQIANLNAGTGASNVIPGHAEIEFNLRFAPETTPEVIKRRVGNCIAAHELNADIDWQLSGMPFDTHSETLIHAVVEAVEQVTGEKPELSTSGGTSDGRFIAPTGTEVIELGPLNATIHQVNECVSSKDLDQLSIIYEGILENLLR